MYSGDAIKRSSVAILSTEAKVVATSEACSEIVLLERLLQKLTVLKQRPILKIDNVAAIHLDEDPESHRRRKHIITRNFFLRELVSRASCM